MSHTSLVVGGGAIGGVIAARLTRAGQRVIVLEANEDVAARLREPGISVDALGEQWVVPLEVVTAASDLQTDIDFALIALKARSIDQAVSALVETDRVDSYVSLGNGLVQDVIADITGRDRLLVGTVSWGATNLGAGHVAQTTRAPIAIGELDGSMTPRLRNLGEVLDDVCEVHLTNRIVGQVWSKLLLNSTFSGLGTVAGGTYAEVMERSSGRYLAHRLWTEGYLVSQALGVDLDEVAGVDPADLVVMRPSDAPRADAAIDDLVSRIGATLASMLQDLRQGLPTEVGVINGGVLREGTRLGVDVPVNAAVTELITGFQAGIDAPDPRHLDALMEALAQ